MKYLLLAPLLLTGCITPYTRGLGGPGGDVKAVDATGEVLFPAARDKYLRQGVPPGLFTETPDGFPHLTNQALHEANNFREKTGNAR